MLRIAARYATKSTGGRSFFPMTRPVGHDHSEKEQAKDQFEIKNSDRNGPEGQFMTASTTMCNAGFPP